MKYAFIIILLLFVIPTIVYGQEKDDQSSNNSENQLPLFLIVILIIVFYSIGCAMVYAMRYPFELDLSKVPVVCIVSLGILWLFESICRTNSDPCCCHVDSLTINPGVVFNIPATRNSNGRIEYQFSVVATLSHSGNAPCFSCKMEWWEKLSFVPYNQNTLDNHPNRGIVLDKWQDHFLLVPNNSTEPSVQKRTWDSVNNSPYCPPSGTISCVIGDEPGYSYGYGTSAKATYEFKLIVSPGCMSNALRATATLILQTIDGQPQDPVFNITNP